jgi:hypothetical protein
MIDQVVSTYYLLCFHRAIDRVAAQADCSVADATDLLLHRAEAEQCSLGDLAIAILEGRVRFDSARDRHFEDSTA